jgi:hypothetical protein
MPRWGDQPDLWDLRRAITGEHPDWDERRIDAEAKRIHRGFNRLVEGQRRSDARYFQHEWVYGSDPDLDDDGTDDYSEESMP